MMNIDTHVDTFVLLSLWTFTAITQPPAPQHKPPDLSINLNLQTKSEPSITLLIF